MEAADKTSIGDGGDSSPPVGLDLLNDDDWSGLSYVEFVGQLEQRWPKHVRRAAAPGDTTSRYVRFCRKCAGRCALNERAYLDRQPYVCDVCGHENIVRSPAAVSLAGVVRRTLWVVAVLGLIMAVAVFPVLGAMGVVGLVFMWVAICGSGAVGLLLIVAMRLTGARLTHRDSSRSGPV